MIDPTKIKYIACKGGGVRICAYAGAAKALEEKGVLQNIEGISGTSAGAIFATLVALNYTSNEIREIILGYDFKKFEDKTIGSVLTSLKDYGYCKGDYFLKAIKKCVKDKTGNENSTFMDIHLKGAKLLKVYATAVDNYNVSVEFSLLKTPNVSVAEAVRASMSIPGMFKAAKITGSKQLYIDGGVTFNFPIHAFDEFSSPDEVLGLFLYNKEEDEEIDPLKTWHPFKFITRTFKSFLKSQDINFFNDEDEVKRTILLDTLGMSSTNFGINSLDKERLFRSGYDCVFK